MKALIGILLVALLMPVVAVAQEWNAYTFPDPGFTIQFPAVPVVGKGTVKNTTGVSLPMTRYVVRQDRIIYTLSVVNYSSTNADALSTIRETERSLGTSGKVTGATGARVNRSFGRELNLDGTDGSRSAIAIFFVNKHLYTVVGQALPPNASEKSDDAIRFQESLQFLDDDGGFFGFFGGSGRSRSGGAAVDRPGGAAVDRSGDTAEARPSSAAGARSKAVSNPPADATCAGKSAGDAVQLQTPGGPVAATCTLVARPNMPPSAAPAP
jgi:hypothetical protein